MSANSTAAPRRFSTVTMPRLGHGHGHGAGRGSGPREKPKKARETIGRVWFYLRRQRAALALTGLMVAGMVALDLTGPILLGRAIDHYIIPHKLSGLWRILIVMLGVYTCSSALNFLQSYIMAGAAQLAMRDIRADLFGKLQRLPLGFFDRRIHGELMARLTSDVEAINQVLSNSVTQIVAGTLSTTCVAVAMFTINPRLAIVSVATIMVFTLLVNRILSAKTQARYRVQQAALGKLYGYIEETIGGQKVIKAYGEEKTALRRFDAVNEEFRSGGIAAQTISGLTGPFMNAINNGALAVVAGAGGILALRGLASIGTIATFINYTRQFGRPLNEVAHLYNAFQSALAGAERVFEIIDEKPETDAAPELRKEHSLRGTVAFNNVTFSYEPGATVLKNVTLRAEAGQTVALIGPTGAGKTTVVNLLTRFYEVDSGTIYINGVDIREIAKDRLRRQLGIVLQDTFLFSGTIKENIRYGRLDASDEEVLAAAKQANADLFIHRLPHGYETVLNERGSNLSHGQRQMISIARAILADPVILILDEATSSVDTRTEKHIQQAMQRLMKGRTSFVIAHRLSTIREADQILVINQGEIQERGDHAELMAQRGFYWRLTTRSASTLDTLKLSEPENSLNSASTSGPG